MNNIPAIRNTQKGLLGIFIACIIIISWGGVLYINLKYPLDPFHPLTYLRVLIQAHLFTGLFITAHDAMHGAVSPGRPKWNHLIGRIAATLFVYNSYKLLRPKHYAHHRHAGTQEDPDFHNGNPHFLRWYLDFLLEYVSWKQVLLAAITYHLLKLVFPAENLIWFWIVPSLLSTLQLFYFGTYLPHRGDHNEENAHHARSQTKNHLWAFISCYFFGYHYEHHDSPQTPWWLLWKIKEEELA